MNTTFARGFALLLAAALANTPALAQTDATPPPAAAPTLPMTAPPPPPALNREEAARVDHYIADLHRRLRITAAEQPQWDVFAQTVRDNATHMDQLSKARHDAAAMNAVEDLKSYAELAEAHAQDMQRLVPTFEALYAAMPPEQQKLADTEFKAFEARGMRRAPHG